MDTLTYFTKQLEHIPTLQYYEIIRNTLAEIKPKRVLEIGTGWGISGTAIVENRAELLVSVDKAQSSLQCKTSRELIEGMNIGTNLVFLDGTIETCFNDIKRYAPYDFIYIDGDHRYEGCIIDLKLSDTILKQGGYIMLDDFLHCKNLEGDYGIIQAIREFVLKRYPAKWEIKLLPTSVNGFCLLRKPL